ncbi:hypothetical protein D3C83_162130 [compost metagenome]
MRISYASFFIGRENRERNGLGFYRAELRNADLPFTKYFQQDSLERMIDLVDLVDQQNAGTFV